MENLFFRGEIEELYEKVTREEYEKSMQAGDKARADSMRALMLVLPYNTDNNTEDNLQVKLNLFFHKMLYINHIAF